jgi:hypothetical protein
VDARIARTIMASSAHPIAEPTAVGQENGDLFDSLAVWLVIALMVVTLIGTVAGLTLVYYGGSVAVPPWDQRSVPAPKIGE